jgi:hypothetical protein
MTNPQATYNKRLAKKVATATADLALPERMIVEWESWLAANADVDFDAMGPNPVPIAMPFWFGDNWKRRAERPNARLQTVARQMVDDAKRRVALTREWIAVAEQFLADQVSAVKEVR